MDAATVTLASFDRGMARGASAVFDSLAGHALPESVARELVFSTLNYVLPSGALGGGALWEFVCSEFERVPWSQAVGHTMTFPGRPAGPSVRQRSVSSSLPPVLRDPAPSLNTPGPDTGRDGAGSTQPPFPDRMAAS